MGGMRTRFPVHFGRCYRAVGRLELARSRDGAQTPGVLLRMIPDRALPAADFIVAPTHKKFTQSGMSTIPARSAWNRPRKLQCLEHIDAQRSSVTYLGVERTYELCLLSVSPRSSLCTSYKTSSRKFLIASCRRASKDGLSRPRMRVALTTADITLICCNHILSSVLVCRYTNSEHAALVVQLASINLKAPPTPNVLQSLGLAWNYKRE